MEEKPAPQPSKISLALKEEIIRLCTEGDPKHGGMFTVEIASHIGRIVKAGRELLLAEKISMNDLDALMKRKRGFSISSSGNSLIGSIPGYGSSDEDPMDEFSSPIQTTMPNENFGMTAIREIVNSLKGFSASQNESPAKLVEALALARENKLDDVAAELEKKLGVTKSLSPMPRQPRVVDGVLMSPEDADRAEAQKVNGAAS